MGLFKNFHFLNQLVFSRISELAKLFKLPARAHVVPKVNPVSLSLSPFTLRWIAPSIHQKFAFAALPTHSRPYAGIKRQFVRPYSNIHSGVHTYTKLPNAYSLLGKNNLQPVIGVRHASSLSSPWEGLVENIRRDAPSPFKPAFLPVEIEPSVDASVKSTPVTQPVYISLLLCQSAAVELKLDSDRSISDISNEIRSVAKLHKKHLYFVAATLEKLDAAGVPPSSYLVQGKEVGVMEVLVPLPVSNLEDAEKWLKSNGICVPSPHFDLEVSSALPRSSSGSISTSISSNVSAARRAEVEDFLKFVRDLANEKRSFDVQTGH